jgi:hypothetical protein
VKIAVLVIVGTVMGGGFAGAFAFALAMLSFHLGIPGPVSGFVGVGLMAMFTPAGALFGCLIGGIVGPRR